MRKKEKKPKKDKLFLILLFILIFLGLLFLISATSIIADEKFNDSFYFLKNQILKGLIPGFLIFLIIQKINLNFIKKISYLLPFISVLLLSLTFFPNLRIKAGGASSWVNLKFFSFQPTEIVKLLMIIYFAYLFSKIPHSTIKTQKLIFLNFLFWLIVITSLILLQKDLGAVLIIIGIGILMFFLSGGNLLDLFVTNTIFLLGLSILIFIAPYRLNRIIAFINPQKDPLGIGYQINQALIGISSGGILGTGLFKSRQKFLYLPQVSSDSIFAIIAEELGFIFTSILIFLLLLFILKIYFIGIKQKDFFRKYISYGIACWIFLQVIINIGAMLKLCPLTGINLPFISYGGSFYTTILAGLGIIYKISDKYE